MIATVKWHWCETDKNKILSRLMCFCKWPQIALVNGNVQHLLRKAIHYCRMMKEKERVTSWEVLTLAAALHELMDAKLSKSEIRGTWRIGHCKMWAFTWVLYNRAHIKGDFDFQVPFVSVSTCHSLPLKYRGTYLVPKFERQAWTLAFLLCDVKLKGLVQQTWFRQANRNKYDIYLL